MFNFKKKWKFLTSIGTTLTMLAIQTQCFATESSTIGTAEVTQATESIKRVITSIAMPLRWCSYFCKCCSCSFKNDC
ncbi:MAG: hypothetical protein ACI4UX_03690 [Clostridia bacterium]